MESQRHPGRSSTIVSVGLGMLRVEAVMVAVAPGSDGVWAAKMQSLVASAVNREIAASGVSRVAICD